MKTVPERERPLRNELGHVKKKSVFYYLDGGPSFLKSSLFTTAARWAVVVIESNKHKICAKVRKIIQSQDFLNQF